MLISIGFVVFYPTPVPDREEKNGERIGSGRQDRYVMRRAQISRDSGSGRPIPCVTKYEPRQTSWLVFTTYDLSSHSH